MIPSLVAALAVWPMTAAESSGYHRTSSFQEVVDFLRRLEENKAPIATHWIGYSAEKRPIPLVVVSDPPVFTPQEARRQGKLVVYIQANIHAGEVEGKEASLILLRRIAQGDRALLKDMVLLVNPIYNADGNEKWGPVATNRPEQDGPDLVGLRPNGQGLDLNRDCIKAESPEMRAALESVYTRWEPDAVLDLHTTDGTRHGYELTYSPPLNPDTPGWVRSYAQDELLPAVRSELRSRRGIETFDYGNLEGTSWRTFGHEGRYVTNYAGLRGAIGILSEATTFIPFQARIQATDWFVTSVLNRLARDKARILAHRNPPVPKELGVTMAMAKGRDEEVIIEKLAPGEPKPLTGRPKVVQRIKVPVYDRFVATKTRPVPDGYVIPPSLSGVIKLLSRHGVPMEVVTKPMAFTGRPYTIDKVQQASRAFQGHKLIQLEATLGEPTPETVEPGSVVVRCQGRLAALVFHLLEPESSDGVVAWGYVGDHLAGPYPIKRMEGAK